MGQRWWTGAEFEEGFAHLLESESIVEGGDWYVAAVENRVRGRVWIQAATRIETSERSLASRGCTDGSRSKACA